MRPSQTFHVLETLEDFPLVPLHRKGVELSLDDDQTVREVYQQWLLLLIDLGYLHLESLKRDIHRLWSDMIKVDVYDLNSAFAECLHSVRMQNSKGFKALCNRISTHLFNYLKDDIVLMSKGDILAGKRLIQVFSYTSRLSLKDIDLTQQQLEDYLSNEERISFPETNLPLLHRLNYYIRRWVGRHLDGEIIPQHGPGGVAAHGRCSLETKYKDLSTDMLLQYAYGTPNWVHSKIRSSLDRISQTIFVPKSYKSFRTISMEPSTLQFFQQGVWKKIDSLVERSRYLRNHIGFRDQSRNQRMAREGSIDRRYATLDLSAASDSVGYMLVKELFRGTWLLRHLIATRSRRTILPDGRLIDLKKFAPMGSALCFPIETIVFASICEHTTRVCGVPGDYSVYGDDIVVPTQCVEMTVHILETLGFIVNRDKSFYQATCWFRESCGGEYLNGIDVTPMKISRKYASVDPQVRYQKLVDLANNAYKRNFRNLRYFFIRKLRDNGCIPLFSPTSLLSDNYTNYHTRKRWNRSLHRIEVRVSDLVTKYNEKDLHQQDEEIRYRHWLLSTAERKHLGLGFQSVICRSTTLQKEAWFMKPYEVLDQDFIDLNRGKSHPSSS